MTSISDELQHAINKAQSGDLGAAIDAYKRLLKTDPAHSETLRYLGLALFEKRAFEDAEDAFKRSISADADNADAHNDLGRTYMALNDRRAAVPCFLRAVEIDEGHFESWHNLGLAYVQGGAVAKAFEAFKTALRLSPLRAQTLYALTDLLFSQGQVADAEKCLKFANQAGPDSVKTRVALARKLSTLGYLDQAEQEFESILEQFKNHVEAWFGYGQICEDRGDREGAIKAYTQAVQLNASHAASIGRLAPLLSEQDLETNLPHWQSLIQGADSPDEDKSLVGYGLGKALERQKNFHAAFDAYSRANRARRHQSGAFDRAAFDARMQRLTTAFSELKFKRADRPASERRPIFIVGMPRSGTTLTEQILSAHPQVHGAGELSAVTDIAGELRRRLCDTPEDWPAVLSGASSALLTEAADDCDISLWQKASDEAIRAIDKSPLNFFHLGVISCLYPEARIIHCRRAPRDVCLSIYAENFAHSQQHATELEDLAYYWLAYDRLMTFWRDTLSLPILDVIYEETVADTEKAARHLCDFAQIGWDAQCLKFYESDRAVSTPSRWQVRRPIYGSSIGRWRHFEDMIGSSLDALPA